MAPEETAARLDTIAARVGALADDVRQGSAAARDLDEVAAMLARVKLDLFGPKRRAARGAGAKVKIRDFLLAHVDEVVTGAELKAIGGIQEWARRVRELRVEDGYDIVEVGDSAYRLRSAVPNRERAEQWALANTISNLPGSARSRIERYLEATVGTVVTRKQIDLVAKIAEGSRRVRELRDEHGWPILSHVDDPTLAPGEYRLLSTDPADRRDASQRMYPEDLRHRVFVRDAYTCQICRRDRAKAEAAGDLRFYLEVHHKVAIADDLSDVPVAARHDMDNLITLCHSDHLRESAALQERKRRARGA
ncbi:MAG TPA: HNH endonuclease signature motif containing protein [Baekduia sp.]|uniref:HNH endonuclease n=1 Tax=Baekduia sp. TaxID=2600305 RepID=UPI002D79A367|nr:HNH endonuclease signature motif containing protein [Baekduia sp.]HET6507113.1 HNH endonuclease signature motif containing protein [Baekduia sp.]